jgi:hypothetical protein
MRPVEKLAIGLLVHPPVASWGVELPARCWGEDTVCTWVGERGDEVLALMQLTGVYVLMASPDPSFFRDIVLARPGRGPPLICTVPGNYEEWREAIMKVVQGST